MRGGHTASGPPPDPDALRRDRSSDRGWITLPAAGHTGPAPEWPLANQTAREGELWEREWRRPQATIWERNGQDLEVALYVRSLVDAESAEAPVTARALVRQQQDALGLSLPGMARNRWRIGAVPQAPTVAARSRFKVVPGGQGRRPEKERQA